MIMPDMTPIRKPPAAPLEPGGNTPVPAPAEGERIVDSRDLLGSGDGLLIRHDGRLYRLRRTPNLDDADILKG